MRLAKPILILMMVLILPALLFAQQPPASPQQPAQNPQAGPQQPPSQQDAPAQQPPQTDQQKPSQTNPQQPPPQKESPAQEEPTPQHGMVEFGARHILSGSVYGRPDLPFTPNVLTSKFNEYSDFRNGFVIPRARILFDDILGTKKYISFQSQSTFYKDQSYLGTFGEYGKFKVQFRYDEIPHVYTNTARTPYVETSPGVLRILPATRLALQANSSTVCATPPCTAAQINLSLPGFIQNQVVPGEAFITPSILRRAGTGSASWYIKPQWITTFSYWREHQAGSRPRGELFNSSPSASASGLPSGVSGLQSPGTGAEVPEPIDYFNNLFQAASEYGQKSWAIRVGYTGSFFQDNITTFIFDNPFATADVPVQLIRNGTGGCTTAPNCVIGAVPAQGQLDLYPSNRAQYFNFAGAVDLGKYVRVMGTANPGWLSQNAPFQPYTSNSQIFFPDSSGNLTVPGTSLSLLPARSLNGQVQTLAMNYAMVFTPLHNVEVKATYRHYDYNNNTAVFNLTPVEGDTIGGNATSTGQAIAGLVSTDGRSNPGFNDKDFELSGEWFFQKTSSVKLGWENDWFGRSHRDVDHSLETSFFGAVDWNPKRDLLFHLSGRHQDRKPSAYLDDNFLGVTCDPTALANARTAGIFPNDQPCSRRFDESARMLDRGDALVQYTMRDLTLSGSFETIQANYNLSGGTNSATPLNFLTGSAATTGNYFLYGALNDLSYIYTFDAEYPVSPEVSLFAEYTFERYHKKMISRNRSPFAAAAPFCAAGGCDSANNDWLSFYEDRFDTYAAGFDFYFWKKLYITPYYSLSAGKDNVNSRFLGDPTITAGADRFVLTGSSAALPYPEAVTRIHELVVVFKYKLSKNLMPKIEYRFQQFDNRDFQTTAMTPYMGCVSPATGAAVIGCPSRQLINPVSPTTNPSPTFTPSQFYPGFVVGDTSAARYLFLGADQPSYGIHVLTVSLEYRF